VAAQAAAALTPDHDDAMPGVGGDTLRDVHRSGVAEFGRSLGIALADRPPDGGLHGDHQPHLLGGEVHTGDRQGRDSRRRICNLDQHESAATGPA
jgi:hypothetical protein